MNFKQFLESLDVSTFIFYDSQYPLSEEIIKAVFNKVPEVQAYHATTKSGLDKLKKIEGSNKSISAFTKMAPRTLKSGVETSGGIIVQVKGNLLAKGNYDIFTGVDLDGMRWISAENSPRMKKFLESVKLKTYKDYTGNSADDLIDFMDLANSRDVDKVIKLFYNNIKELSKKNKKLIYDFLFKDGREYSQITDYNELILNKIKIQKVYLLKDSKGYDPTIPGESIQSSDLYNIIHKR